MKMVWISGLVMLLYAGQGFAAIADHAKIEKYEGTKTCLACHPNAAKEVAQSLHYQQRGQANFLKDWPTDKPVGMMVSY